MRTMERMLDWWMWGPLVLGAFWVGRALGLHARQAQHVAAVRRIGYSALDALMHIRDVEILRRGTGSERSTLDAIDAHIAELKDGLRKT